jgi:hypothetical protein
VDQANVGTLLSNVGHNTFTRISDRWFVTAAASVTGTVNSQNIRTAGGVLLPGTNFKISANYQLIQVGTTQTTLAAGDAVWIQQYVEGPFWRELSADVHSISVLAYSSNVAPYTFSVALRDPSPTKSLVMLCTITTAGVWQLFTLPNLPNFPAGNFTNAIGSMAYSISICIACGTSLQAPATGSWQTGNYVGAAGMTNGLAAANNFNVAFIQHEPGPQCTTLIDKPFSQNLDECLRYYQKSFSLATLPGSASPGQGYSSFTTVSTSAAMGGPGFRKDLAKQPTVTVYNGSTGAAGSAWNNNTGTSPTVSPSQIGPSGFTVLAGSGFTAGQVLSVHYTAETGW